MARSSGKPGPAPDSLGAAIAHLEGTERELVAAGQSIARQLDVTRSALASLRTVTGVAPGATDTPPAPPGRQKQIARRVARVKVALEGAPSDAKVRALLKDGPVAPRVFREHFGLSSYVGAKVLADLEERGVVQVTGVTVDRRITLPGHESAKEEP
ncbi:MAG TPA: hypothetical protein VM364_07950 [Vicinamibacterales bacterium]|nr:hypothetical protein [Vicinamibacterales bacterium]